MRDPRLDAANNNGNEHDAQETSRMLIAPVPGAPLEKEPRFNMKTLVGISAGCLLLAGGTYTIWSQQSTSVTPPVTVSESNLLTTPSPSEEPTPTSSESSITLILQTPAVKPSPSAKPKPTKAPAPVETPKDTTLVPRETAPAAEPTSAPAPKPPTPITPPKPKPAPVVKTGTLSIPGLGARETLTLSGDAGMGIGVAKGSPLPGRTGNSILITDNPGFARLGQLKTGDTLTVDLPGKTPSVFEIRAILNTSPNNENVTRQVEGVRLTILVKGAKQMLVIEAELVDGANINNAVPGAYWQIL